MTPPADWERLRELFEGALACPLPERAAFLDERINGDDAMRREIESLLAAHAAADRFLTNPAGPADHVVAEMIEGGPRIQTPRLATGTRLGVFEILEPLGVGGMGEVYRARDTRLDRFVAIKVLTSDLEVAPRGRERFEREARAISKLSHPHICTVHDIGSADIEGRETPFLVMELLDGETLADRLGRGPLALDESLTIAIDVADALAAAHGQGVVHRDLKPANVMVTTSGVKLLDFGLAQLRGPDASNADGRDVSLTSAGLVFGTVPYMAPEQLRVEKADARTDVFAFGALLHEMLTGTRPFAADSQAALIAAILEHDPPPVSEFQPQISPGLDRIVRKCLAKDPDDRWQTARDLKSELVWVRDGREDVRRARASIPPATRRRKWRQLIAVGIPTLAAITLAVVLWRMPPRTVAPLSFNLPPGVTLFIPVNGTSIAIAPDGSRHAFIGVRAGLPSLFIHQFDTGKTFEVPETRNAITPMFSADSQWVAFGQAGIIKKIPATGGPVEAVGPGAAGPMAWLSDGRFVRSNMSGTAIRQVVPVVPDGDSLLTKITEGEEGHLTPLLMRNGWLLFTSVRGGFLSSLNSIRVRREDAAQTSELVPNASSPQLLGTDAIVFARGSALFAAGFDSRGIRLTGDPRAMNVQVQTTLVSGAPMFAVANNGTLVYAEPSGGRRLAWIDRDGREELVKTGERMYGHLRLSPDGTRVAAPVLDADRDLWVFGLDGSYVQRMTSGPARDVMPVWSADGSQIFYTTAERNINRVPADRSTLPETILTLQFPDRIHPTDITRDRRHLVANWDILPKAMGIRLVEVGPPAGARLLLGESGTERDGRLSRDGRWIAYQSAESTTDPRDGQIIVRPFPDVQGVKFVVSGGGGRQPIWSHDGRELFYRTEDGTVMSVPITTTPTFKAGTPKPVVPAPANTLREWASGPTYDVSPDGKSFLFIKAPELDIHSLTVILNWDVAVKAALSGKGR